jgi:hypothetical protein
MCGLFARKVKDCQKLHDFYFRFYKVNEDIGFVIYFFLNTKFLDELETVHEETKPSFVR